MPIPKLGESIPGADKLSVWLCQSRAVNTEDTGWWTIRVSWACLCNLRWLLDILPVNILYLLVFPPPTWLLTFDRPSLRFFIMNLYFYYFLLRGPFCKQGFALIMSSGKIKLTSPNTTPPHYTPPTVVFRSSIRTFLVTCEVDEVTNLHQINL